MADLTVSSDVDTFLQASNKAGMRTALELPITIPSGQTVTFSGAFSATFTLTGATTVTFPTSGTLVTTSSTSTLTGKTFDTAGAGNSFLINGLAATANTGTGAVVRATSPTLVTPNLGTATCTTINGLDISGNGLLELNGGGLNFSAAGLTIIFDVESGNTASVVFPISGTLYGTATDSFNSAQLKTSLTDGTGTDGCVFATAPTMTSVTATFSANTPAVNDGCALGSSTLSYSDLFLASGAVFNIANGNWVATHTSGILTVGTGDLRVTTAGTNSASVVTVGGTQTLTNKTLTEPEMTSPVITGGIDVTGGVAADVASFTGAVESASLTVSNTIEADLTVSRIRPPLTNYIGDGAISTAQGFKTISKGSAAAMTVAAPSSQDGDEITIMSATNFGHIVTFTGATLLDGTSGGHSTATFAAFTGASLTVVAYGGNWYVKANNAVTIT